MNRIHGWEKALQLFLTEYRNRPFEWAVNDCATFAGEWVKRATGQVLFEPDYTDAMGAARRMGGQTEFAAQVTAILGEPAANTAMAGRGDVVLVGLDGRSCLGVVEGMYVAAPGEQGMTLIPRTAILTLWSI
ncbi:MAG: hypothetical protein ACEQSH_00710 [Bacteroidia bacterium]